MWLYSRHSNFDDSDLFRTSGFEFRISGLKSNRRISQFVERAAQIREDVAGKQRFFALSLLKDRHLSGAAANPGADPAAIVEGQTSSCQSSANSGEDVTHSAAGHAGISGGVVADRFPALAHDGATTLE